MKPLFEPFQERPHSRNRLSSGACLRYRAQWLVVFALLFSFVAGCGRKPLPPASPAESSPPPPAAPSADKTDPAVTAPVLSLRVEPARIRRGESALLTWNAENSDRVTIEPVIGAVEPSGRITFFPEETTTYAVTATGSGGSVSETVTVEVISDGSDFDLTEEDLRQATPETLFAASVKPVFFEFDSATLTPEAELTLQGNARWLLRRENRQIRFLIEGHADERGSEEYNLALGESRSQAVKKFLIEQGIEPVRMQTVSLGEERPFDPRHVEEAYALNRRVHFVLLGEATDSRQAEGRKHGMQ